MRILHIIGTLDPAAGGPTEWVRAQIDYAPEATSFEVVTLDDPSSPFLCELPFPVHGMGPVSTTYGYTPKLLPWLIANRNRFDGVVVNGLWQYCGKAAHTAFFGHIPYLVFTHGMLDPYFKRVSLLKHWKKMAYWYPVEYRVLRDAHRVLFTTELEDELAKKSFLRHSWNAAIVPIGTVLPEGDTSNYLRAFYELYPRVESKRFLLFLGRIHRKKGCDLLIDAFSKVAADDSELHLVIAGPDQHGWQATLEARAQGLDIAERVHWPGMLMGTAKWGAFLASEAFVLPSHQENFGVAVAEALACGKPALISDQVNISSEIQEDGAGYVEHDTLEGTVSLLKRWISTPPDMRTKMAEQAKKTFHARYDMRVNARVLIQIFEEAVL